MGKPLFTDEENAKYEAKKAEINKEYNEIRSRYMAGGAYPQEEYNKNSEKSKALEEARKIQTVRRTQARPEEFVNGLLVLVGSRGQAYVEFDAALEQADSEEVKQLVKQYDTPEARRNLHTILKALTEIPKSWAMSAFIRFLRGTGKQKDAKYHGAGTFGPLYGWKENEVHSIVGEITGSRFYSGYGSYSSTLMRYADVQDEIYEARQNSEDGADGYEEVPYGTEFVAVRAERDVEFLNKLCEILKARGLGEIPTPAEKKAPKPRKVKQFEPGDVIKKTTIRDLPLPAHIRIDAKKRTWKNGKAEDSEGPVEIVVTKLHDGSGYVNALTVKPKTKKAYPTGMGKYTHRYYLEGATFLGKWEGEIIKNKELKLDFNWWPKDRQY